MPVSLHHKDKGENEIQASAVALGTKLLQLPIPTRLMPGLRNGQFKPAPTDWAMGDGSLRLCQGAERFHWRLAKDLEDFRIEVGDKADVCRGPERAERAGARCVLASSAELQYFSAQCRQKHETASRFSSTHGGSGTGHAHKNQHDEFRRQQKGPLQDVTQERQIGSVVKDSGHDLDMSLRHLRISSVASRHQLTVFGTSGGPVQMVLIFDDFFEHHGISATHLRTCGLWLAGHGRPALQLGQTAEILASADSQGL